MSRPRWRLAPALAMVLAVAACGVADDETARPKPRVTAATRSLAELPELPVGAGHVGPDTRVRAQGSTLVVDGRPVDLAPMRVDEFAVVRGGIFFRNGTELWFTDLSRARATGFGDVRSLAASPDGRRLAFLDFQDGPEDGHGTPLAMSIAYDATTGTPLVASDAGMGDVAKDDLTDLYEDGEPAILGFEGEALLVHGATGADYRVPLDGSRAEKVTAPAT